MKGFKESSAGLTKRCRTFLKKKVIRLHAKFMTVELIYKQKILDRNVDNI